MTIKPYDDLKEKSLGMIAFFETSLGFPEGFGVTAGNFDGAGLSHGILQQNFVSGSLQPLWNYLNTEHNQLCRNVFGSHYAEWADVLTRTTAQQIAWGDSITNQANKHRTIEPWNTMFYNLGISEPSIDKQVERSAIWREPAERWFKQLGLWSRRGYALIFSISIQMGRFLCMNLVLNDFKKIDTTGKTRAQIEEEKLRIIAARIASGDNRVFPTAVLPNLPEIVYNRKIAIVNGTSNQGFNMNNYDLHYETALKGSVRSG
jgi:hypothetical protein